MKSVNKLRNPDIIEINGERFQVINNTSLLYHKNRKELEMVIELVKTSDKNISPDYRITYFIKSSEMKFFSYDKKSKEWKQQKIRTIMIRTFIGDSPKV
ncbi:MAG: hypothetical protein QMD85_04145 [Candidatus Aenigmarchaeota archaeon]|nr:hypothetical protein [Candidatus Aenigmarchaeota archaeon]MDI6722757.1 hypothetical protein [Candidatus Aenigmarchaeota archaeon]